MRLTSQFLESRRIPMVKPMTVARTMPHPATSRVLRMPTTAARRCVDLESYSINGENDMS